jgi:hypothetical protein
MANNQPHTEKIATSFYLDKEMFHRLVEESDDERRTYSQQMNLILAERYAPKGKKP